MRLLFPDVNVWLALHHEFHPHHKPAVKWFESLQEGNRFVFCRQTQLGLFRLLTTASVMLNEPRTNRQCWALFTKWMENGKAELWDEPRALDHTFHRNTAADQSSPKVWTDAYLAAFAEAAGLKLVTFDKALAGKTKGAVLLD